MDTFREQAQINQQVSKSLIDLTTTVASLKTSVDNMQKEPGDLRSAFGTYGGCLGQLIVGCISCAAILLSLLTYLAQHWK